MPLSCHSPGTRTNPAASIDATKPGSSASSSEATPTCRSTTSFATRPGTAVDPMWSSETAASPTAWRIRASRRAAWAGHRGSDADSVGCDRRERMPCRRLSSNGSIRSCHSRSTDARSASVVASLSSQHVGRGAPRVVVGLCGDARPGVGLVHPALLDEAAHADLLGGTDDDHEVVVGAHALLDEQRHVVHDDGVRAGVVDDLGGSRPDGRVGQRLQVAQCRVVAEHDPAQRRAVERTVGPEHSRAEPVGHGGQRRGARLDDLARHGIRVDDDGAERGELSRHGRLAGPDSPGEAHTQHAGDPSARCPGSRVVVREPGREAARGDRPPAGRA